MSKYRLFRIEYTCVVLCSCMVLFSLICRGNDSLVIDHDTKAFVPVIDRTILIERQRILVSGTMQYDNAQSDQRVIFPICDSSNKWGFISVDGRIIMPPQFEDVRKTVSDGLLAVKINGLWGIHR